VKGITYRRAQQLRRTLTRAEARLWTALRRRDVDGLKFRRQHPIGPYVLDFYCAERRLAVEVDGGVHDNDEAVAYDRARTKWLARQGVRVIRCTNEEVRDSLGGVVAWIMEQAEAR
jgi:very-short-patch-repair endonuclease